MNRCPHPLQLRVALVASSLKMAGAEKQLFYLARCLHESGVNVRIFNIGNGGHYASLLRQTGISLVSTRYSGRPWAILWQLIGQFAKFRPHIVHAAQFGNIFHAAIPGRLCRALTLGAVRSDGEWEYTTYGRRSTWLSRLPHALVLNSDCARGNLQSRGVPSGKMHVLPNVIDLCEFDSQAAQPCEIEFPEQSIVAAAVGRLTSEKRFDRFIQALALAREQSTRLCGAIIGPDEGTGDALRQKAAAVGLDQTKLLFIAKHSNVPSVLAKVAIVVLSSQTEGFPNVLLEAMAAGKPVISTPAGDAARLVRHGQTGFIVDFNDIAGMARCLIQLSASTDLRTRLSLAGRRVVEEHYRYQLHRARVLGIYHRAATQCRMHHVLEQLCGLQQRKTLSPQIEPFQ